MEEENLFYDMFLEKFSNSGQLLKRVLPYNWEKFVNTIQVDKHKAMGLHSKVVLRREKNDYDLYKISPSGNAVEVTKFQQYPPEAKEHHGTKQSFTFAQAISMPYFAPPVIDNAPKEITINAGILVFLTDLKADPNILLGNIYRENAFSYDRKYYAETKKQAQEKYDKDKDKFVKSLEDFVTQKYSSEQHNEVLARAKYDKFLFCPTSFSPDLDSKIETQLRLADFKISDEKPFTDFRPAFIYKNTDVPPLKAYFSHKQIEDLNEALNLTPKTEQDKKIKTKAMLIQWFKEDFNNKRIFLETIDKSGLKEYFLGLLTGGELSNITTIKLIEKIINKPINFTELGLNTTEAKNAFIDKIKTKMFKNDLFELIPIIGIITTAYNQTLKDFSLEEPIYSETQKKLQDLPEDNTILSENSRLFKLAKKITNQSKRRDQTSLFKPKKPASSILFSSNPTDEFKSINEKAELRFKALLEKYNTTQNPNEIDEDYLEGKNNTLLHLACYTGSYEIAKELLKKEDLNIFQKNSAIKTPLDVAIDVLKKQSSPQHQARMNEIINLIKEKEKKFLINKKNVNYNETLEFINNNHILHKACRQGDIETVAFLLEEFPDIKIDKYYYPHGTPKEIIDQQKFFFFGDFEDNDHAISTLNQIASLLEQHQKSIESREKSITTGSVLTPNLEEEFQKTTNTEQQPPLESINSTPENEQSLEVIEGITKEQSLKKMLDKFETLPDATTDSATKTSAPAVQYNPELYITPTHLHDEMVTTKDKPTQKNEIQKLIEVFNKYMQENDLEKLKQFIIDNPILKEYKDNNGNSLLHIVSKELNVPMIQMLLELKFDPNVYNNSGETPLHILAASPVDPFMQLVDYKEIVVAFKNAGADLDCRIKRKNPTTPTPLCIAIFTATNYPLVLALLENQANIDLKYSPAEIVGYKKKISMPSVFKKKDPADRDLLSLMVNQQPNKDKSSTLLTIKAKIEQIRKYKKKTSNTVRSTFKK